MFTFVQSDPAAASTSLEGIYCIRSCYNFCLRENFRERECSKWSILAIQNNLSPPANIRKHSEYHRYTEGSRMSLEYREHSFE